MTKETTPSVFEDFNDRQESADLVVTVEVPVSDPTNEETWTAGFLAARRDYEPNREERGVTAQLVASVFAMNERISATVDSAALALADLLIVAVSAENAKARWADQLRAVADHIKPALIGAPEYWLSDHQGLESHYGELSEMMQALSAGSGCETVSIRWRQGEARISSTSLVHELRQALVPLTSGSSNQQHDRDIT